MPKMPSFPTITMFVYQQVECRYFYINKYSLTDIQQTKHFLPLYNILDLFIYTYIPSHQNISCLRCKYIHAQIANKKVTRILRILQKTDCCIVCKALSRQIVDLVIILVLSCRTLFPFLNLHPYLHIKQATFIFKP